MPRVAWLLLFVAMTVGCLVWALSGKPAELGRAPIPILVGASPLPVAGSEPQVVDGAQSRTVVADEAEDGAFHSEDDEGQVLVDAVRDGIVIEVRDSNGAPCGECPVKLYWRKGWGLYGFDRGRTENDGTFATTVAQTPFFESFSIEHPVHGDFQSGAVPIATADDPRRVVYVLPRMVDIDVVVRDLVGVPVEGALLEIEAQPAAVGLRETVLAVWTEDEPPTDANGRTTVRLPLGTAKIGAHLAEGEPVQEVEFQVLPTGGVVDLLVIRPEARIRVGVEVVMPGGFTVLQQRAAWSDSPLPPPSSTLVTRVVNRNRHFQLVREGWIRGDGTRHFHVDVDPLPWHLSVHRQQGDHGCLDVPAGQRMVRYVVPREEPAAVEQTAPIEMGPRAIVRVRVLDVSGRPIDSVMIYVHEQPNLCGSRQVGWTRSGTCEFSWHPGCKVCVTAEHDKFPIAIGGPIELTAGTHEIELQMTRPGTVRGVVVDVDGTAVPSTVRLRRPGGAFRAMSPDGPEFFQHSAARDTVRTTMSAKFSFRTVGEGEHEVWAFPDRGGLPARRRVRAGDEVTLRPGDGCEDLVLFAVKPVDADTGELLDLTTVCVEEALFASRRAAAGEPFTCAVRPGEVEVRVRALDHVSFVQKVRVTAEPPVFEAQLEPSPLRFLRVVDTESSPRAQFMIAAFDEDGDAIEFLGDVQEIGFSEDAEVYYGNIIPTDLAGRAVLRGLPRRACKLVVEKEGVAQKQEFALPADKGLVEVFDLVWKN